MCYHGVSMAITWYRIKKWTKMLFGRSILHVKQDRGKCYDFKHLSGYYNDLTLKVLKDKKTFRSEQIPLYPNEKGELEEFSIGVFQYALGAYDLLLLKGEERFKKKFLQCVAWAKEKQNPNGSYDTFSLSKISKTPYSSMAQAEAASMFFRAYQLTKDEGCLERAQRCLDFMLTDELKGGCTRYTNGEVVLLERPLMAPVLNGWVFSIFGLMDACTLGLKQYKTALRETICSLLAHLDNYDAGKWSLYSEDGIIASPAYQRIHVALLSVLFDYNGDERLALLAKKWRRQAKNPFLRCWAMLRKFRQKAKE